MHCSEFDRFLEQESDRPLSSDAAGHLDACPDCRLLWHDLAEIRTASLDWGADTPVPPARAWVALRAQLESEGLIHQPAPQGWRWLDSWFGSAPRMALAAASLSLLLIAGSLVSIRNLSPAVLVHHSEFSAASFTSSIAPADLNRTLDGDMELAMASIPAQEYSVTTSLQKNLGIVDNLIAVCEKSVREQPDNQMARDYLYGAYQQKAVLLATAMDHSTLEGR